MSLKINSLGLSGGQDDHRKVDVVGVPVHKFADFG
jgi:hypothetical protein